MTFRMSTVLLPALLVALGAALFQAPAHAGETAMNTGTHTQSADTQIEDAHRWGD
tara:strand:- start:736 stop:900 length:165 start_codon:yes stop_codon:yes gene_type:complete